MDTAEPANYPVRLEADVVLADGGTVHVRPIRPDDGPPIEALHARLSAETIYLRFFSPLPRLSPQLLARFTHVDYDERLALVAELADQIVAVARYDRLPGTGDAEVAFLVDDAHQGRGLGTILLEHLAVAAREQGINRFVAETLPGNTRMLGVFRDAGFQEVNRFDGQVIRVSFPITPTPASIAAAEGREERSAARSVQRLLAPRSIAVIGASRRPHTIGHEVLVNLLRHGFEGPVYPVHPVARSVASVRAYPTVLDVPDDVDLAIVVLPAEQVAEAVEQCGRKKVGGLVVVSAGFADAGPDGAAAERRLVEQARGLGMRMIGPNTMGVINTAPSVAMNATISSVHPGRGRVGFSSQSGALGITILAELHRIGLGVSTFVSLGNKADVSSNDLLHFWQNDEATDVVLLYLETFGNPRTFARAARRLSRTKPIVAVRSARRSSRAVVDALFHQTGVIRVDNLEQLFDVAQLLVHQPLPAGRRVAIVSNADGPANLAADACESGGLETGDPLNLGPNATAAAYEEALERLLADDAVDAVITLFLPPLVVGADEVEAAIARAASTRPDKPVVATFLGRDGVGRSGAGTATVPSYRFPESAAHALALVADYADWRRRPEGAVPALDGVETERARAVVERVLAGVPDGVQEGVQDGTWLDQGDAIDLLGAYGVAVDPDTPAANLPHAVDTVLGLTQDPSFGPVLQFGVAGFAAGLGPSAFEQLGQPAHRVLPLTDLDAAELLRSVRGSALLFGQAGHPPVDVAALEDLILRVSALADDVPDVAELDLRPVVVATTGLVVASARVRLARWRPLPERAVRRLR